jgi:hypothetical protein
MKPPAREALAERIEQLETIETVAEPLQAAARTLIPQR